MTRTVSNPTYVHTFFVATPGSWQPITVNSDSTPTTFAELDVMLGKVAEMVGVDRQFIRPAGPYVLWAEPYVDPSSAKATSQLLVPNGKLIVPGRD